jgi:hypothetical protein
MVQPAAEAQELLVAVFSEAKLVCHTVNPGPDLITRDRVKASVRRQVVGDRQELLDCVFLEDNGHVLADVVRTMHDIKAENLCRTTCRKNQRGRNSKGSFLAGAVPT